MPTGHMTTVPLGDAGGHTKPGEQGRQVDRPPDEKVPPGHTPALVDSEDREQKCPAAQSATRCPHCARVTSGSGRRGREASQAGASPARALPHTRRRVSAVSVDTASGRGPSRALNPRSRVLRAKVTAQQRVPP